MKRYIIAMAVILSLVIPAAVSAQSATSTCINLSKDLRYSLINKEVSTLQGFLGTKGYLNSKPTGYFGPMTLAAVKKYQSAKKISTTGNVGPLTRASLKSETCGAVLSAHTENTNSGATTQTASYPGGTAIIAASTNTAVTETVTTTTGTTGTGETASTTPRLGDLNGDGHLSIADFIELATMFNTSANTSADSSTNSTAGSAQYNPLGDLNSDGVIDAYDFRKFEALFQLEQFGTHLRTGDLNHNGTVSIADFIDIATLYGKAKDDEGYNEEADLDYNDKIDQRDFAIMDALFKLSNVQ